MSLTLKTYGTKTLSVYGVPGAKEPAFHFPGLRYFVDLLGNPTVQTASLFTFQTTKKAIMQNLNDRLASFIQKVQSLNGKKAELERNINEWCASHTVVSHEYSGFLATIESLQDQIQQISKSNGEAELNIQDALLVANDFRSKYELELAIRTFFEAETVHSWTLMDELTLSRSTLEMEHERLREERIDLEKNHEEEKAQVLAQAVVQVDVSVDAAPSTDLIETLTKMREDYEAVTAKNQRDQEVWYQNKITTVQTKSIDQTEDLEHNTAELSQLKSHFHKLQIELQTQQSKRMSLEASLQDSATFNAAQLADLQKIITDLEHKLKQIQANITNKKGDYDTLMEEIKKYRLLLEGNSSDPQVARKKIAVIKVVESSQTVKIQ